MSNRKHAMWNCRLSNMPEEGNMEINIFKVQGKRAIFKIWCLKRSVQFSRPAKLNFLFVTP